MHLISFQFPLSWLADPPSISCDCPSIFSFSTGLWLMDLKIIAPETKKSEKRMGRRSFLLSSFLMKKKREDVNFLKHFKEKLAWIKVYFLQKIKID